VPLAADDRLYSAPGQPREYRFEELSQQYYGQPFSALVSQLGRTAAEKLIFDLATTPISAPGARRGDPGDDLTTGDRDLVDALFASANAAARRAAGEAARARAEERARLRASLTREMKYGPFAMPFNVSKYINAVVKKNGNMDMLLNMIFADKRFKKAFPGILDRHGDIKMTTAEYQQRRDEAKAEFAKHGLGISDAQFGYMMSKNVSPNEAAARAQIAGFIKGNADVLLSVKAQIAEQNAARKAAGRPPLVGLDTMKDIQNFVTRQSAGELYATVDAGVIMAAAKRAGITVAGGRARELSAATAGIEDIKEATQKFKNVADRIRGAGVELASIGLTQADLETIEFGGAGQADLAAKAEQVLRNRAAAGEKEIAAEGLKLEEGRPVAEVRQAAGA
jgi:hypothetical protein